MEEARRQVFNILPLHDLLIDDAALNFPHVRAAMQALRLVEDGNLASPPDFSWREGTDMMDWLGAFFGFQLDNVKNQREHVVLLLANYQMRLEHPPDKIDRSVVQHLRKKLLKNYRKWCSFLCRKTNFWFATDSRAIDKLKNFRKWFSFLGLPSDSGIIDHRRELMYSCLYLLIWGEAANLRFMPECLCFIFHNMANELNRILDRHFLASTAEDFLPASFGKNGFLQAVVTPIYNAVKDEAEASKDGKPPSVWRNYDDMNEYFWTKRCFKQLGWPLNGSSNYLVTRPTSRGQKVGKTGFVEQRSFWNIFRSFDHLWIGHILMLQAMMILAFNGDGIPWKVLHDRDVQGSVLSIFITWSGLRLLLALLDAGMQYSLISRETKLVALRLTLKVVAALGWTVIFSILFARVWIKRTRDRGWSREANLSVVQFLETACVFLLPEALAILLFILPWIRNFVETSEWKLFHALTWWFQTRLFVVRGLREGIIDNIKYTFFWLSMLLAKFSFSYFLQIRPLVGPTQELLKLNVVSYEWHEFFTNHNRFIVVVLWAPVILIYLMDLQIWYSIFSSLVGVALGLSSHLGEIRTVEQLKLRFPFFASAMTFSLMPTARLPKEQAYSSWTLRCKDMMRRVQLRYGLGKAYEKFESSTLEARKFACIWNEIISLFREEDLVSDQEVELLEIPWASWNNDQEVELSEIPRASGDNDQEVELLRPSWNKDASWSKEVVQWPSVLLSNELLIALVIAQRWEGDDNGLWIKISRNEYRKCAVVECYASLKHLLGRILTKGSKEHSIVENTFAKIEGDLKLGAFTRKYSLGELMEVHTRVLALVEILLEKPSSEDLQRVVVALQNLYDAVRDLPTSKHRWEFLRDAGMTGERGQLLFVNVVELPDAGNHKFFRSLRRFRTTLSTREAMNNVPMNLEARRRIAFFSNSLFMNMPHAPSVERMLAFSVLTPYYREEVLYSDAQLRTANEDGITILFYLQSIYPDEWRNFLERTERQTIRNPETNLEVRLWASFRGQTLSRTVRGMMYYQFALERLAYLDAASEQELQRAVQSESLDGRRSSDLLHSRHSLSSSSGSSSGLNRTSQEKATALLKFTYVIACQIYGLQKAKKDPRAEDILFLMKRHPAVRVAYVDVKSVGDEEQYFSVLVKYDQDLKAELEIYRIRLPGPFKLGEGKPENQNHALIFTRGEAVQTIDMNQDNYFEEALKVRNLLQEFTCCYGLRRPQILGIRENVFTGSVSSLASFMSAQETVFVTLGQRVLANPLKIRMHYGHPDMFDRLWFLSRGGISKASRVINISEDIFAGFNCTMRGGNVTHHEYIQVGKGRDVGLNQIALFEAKVAGGNGEQILSRDVYRLGHRLDFFRMLSFYYTTVGFYISNMLIVLTVYAFLWGRVYLVLSGLEKAIAGDLSNSALTAAINQQFIVQLGLFTVLPMVVENSLEQGFSTAVWNFLTMQLQFCSVFFTFSMGTKCHYFGRTLLHGGAKYRATGRGFVVKHEKFAENYRLYARSHFVKGVELIILLIIYEAYGGPITNTAVYILLTFSSWFLALSWIMGPFLFNPSGFDWLQTVYDFEDFQNWIWYKGGVLIKPDQSWEVWWNEEQDHLRTTGIWGKVLEVVLSLRFFLIQYGMVYRLNIAAHNKSIVVYLVSWFYVIVSTVVVILGARAGERYSAKQHLFYRGIQSLFALALLLFLVLLFELTQFKLVDIFLSFLVFIPTGWGLLSIALVVKPLLRHTSIWPCVTSVARLYELVIGIIVMTPLAMLSWLPGFQAMQTRILFNQAFSRGLQISRILAGKKPNQGF